MKTDYSKDAGDTAGAGEPRRRLRTISQFCERNPHKTQSAVRNDVHKAEPRQTSKGEIAGNGMKEFGVIVRVGKRVYIDEDAYFRWVDAQQERR